MSNYGLHIQEVVSDTHRAVINLTEQDAADQTDSPPDGTPPIRGQCTSVS
jgi:hypothetical protein